MLPSLLPLLPILFVLLCRCSFVSLAKPSGYTSVLTHRAEVPPAPLRFPTGWLLRVSTPEISISTSTTNCQVLAFADQKHYLSPDYSKRASRRKTYFGSRFWPGKPRLDITPRQPFIHRLTHYLLLVFSDFLMKLQIQIGFARVHPCQQTLPVA